MKTFVIPDMTTVDAASAAVEAKLALYPGHMLYEHAKREIGKIRDLRNAMTVDHILGTNLGIMCVRELEADDPETCDLIYAMLNYIRSLTGMSRDERMDYARDLADRRMAELRGHPDAREVDGVILVPRQNDT